MKPTEKELDGLKVGEMVRLFFMLKFDTGDNCEAERMWVEISEINDDHLKGYLTNQPVYIKDLKGGDVVEFHRSNIATLIVKATFDEKKQAIISRKALERREINWLLRDKPLNTKDSGWQFFYGDEDEAYLDDPQNATVISLEEVLEFEPQLEKAFASKHNAFEWDEEEGLFVQVKH